LSFLKHAHIILTRGVLNLALAEIRRFFSKYSQNPAPVRFRVSAEFSECRRMEHFIHKQFQRIQQTFFSVFTLQTAISRFVRSSEPMPQ